MIKEMWLCSKGMTGQVGRELNRKQEQSQGQRRGTRREGEGKESPGNGGG